MENIAKRCNLLNLAAIVNIPNYVSLNNHVKNVIILNLSNLRSDDLAFCIDQANSKAK